MEKIRSFLEGKKKVDKH